MMEYQTDNMFASDMINKCLSDLNNQPLEASLEEN